MKFRLEMKGNKALLKNLGKIGKNARKRIGEQITSCGVDIETGARNRVPVDTGFLKGSIAAQEDPANLRSRIEVGQLYAPYVEFGTGGMVDVPKGLESYAMKFKGKGIKEVNLPPRPFLFPSFEVERPKLVKNIEKVLKEETK